MGIKQITTHIVRIRQELLGAKGNKAKTAAAKIKMKKAQKLLKVKRKSFIKKKLVLKKHKRALKKHKNKIIKAKLTLTLVKKPKMRKAITHEKAKLHIYKKKFKKVK